jgi:MYXO-CTERM domain-containing protein
MVQCSNPRVSYFGGPVLQAPVVVAVFWNGSVEASIRSSMGQFYSDVVQSPYWDALHEYGTVGITGGTEQAIVEGTGGGSFTLTPSRCATSAACSLTDDQLQAELVRQIGLGNLPAPDLDCTGNVRTVYMVSFPSNVSLTGPPGTGTSCVNGGFCAYHNTGTYGTSGTPLLYGAVMDTFVGGCSMGCGGNASAFDNATETASHELVEVATDADIGLDFQSNYASPAAWGDNNNMCGEIADICDDGGPGDTISVGGRSWVVQEFWSNAQRKCVSTAPVVPVCTGSTSTGCRRCSCADDGVACGGATPVCETDSSSALYGACQACTASSAVCAGGGTCVSDQCVGGDAGTIADSGSSGPEAGTGDSGPSTHRDAGSDAGMGAGTREAGQPADAEVDSASVSPDAASSSDATASGADSGAYADASLAATFDSGATQHEIPWDDGGDAGTGDAGRPAGCSCRTAGRSAQPREVGGATAALLLALRLRRRKVRGERRPVERVRG